ncbi:MAG TPA: hypothetical protein VH120_07730 [Gemmataceae bacterium]|jgi:hypothetical protein|nr:hypothetical protein [Gemmataceae bacterium]
MPSWTMLAKAPMKKLLPSAVRRAVRKWTAPPAAPTYPFHKLEPGKLEAIDYAVQSCGVRSFADLGGIWNVDGGYTIYALEKHGLREGCLVDYTFTPAVERWGARCPGLRTIRGNFANEAVAAQVGRVDAAFLFHVLLHQVDPDWAAVLELYAKRVNCFVIVNPQYHARKTFRLLDRGRAEYFRHVPPGNEARRQYQLAFDDPDGIEPVLGCRHRDNPSIWQWGMTDEDLIAKVRSLGFRLRYFKYVETWPMPHVESHAFVFEKSSEPQY